MKKKVCLLVVCLLVAACAAPACAQESRSFVDSTGREIALPDQIARIAVTGAMSQHVLFALAPDMLVGISSPWPEEAMPYIQAQYLSLPVLGQLYGGKGTMNLEALLAAEPDLVLDVGQGKTGMGEELDQLSRQTGIPFLHIDADLLTFDSAFVQLGELLNRQEEANALAQFWREGIQKAQKAANGGPKTRLLYIVGTDGLGVIAKGSYQASVIDYMADNAAVVDAPSSRGTGNEVDMEQLLLWDPECIIFSSGSVFQRVAEDALWQKLTAVQNDRFYEAPYGPDNWMGFPPSCQRMLGMLWMGKLLYPDAADYDLYEETQQYFRLFYHCELTKTQFDQLVANSIGKAGRNESKEKFLQILDLGLTDS